MAIASLLEPVFPAMMKELLDNGFSKATGKWDYLIYPGILMAIFLFRAILGFIGDYAMSFVSNNVVATLRKEMFANILRFPTEYFGDNTSGRLMSRVTYDVGNVTGAATGALTTLIKDSLSIVGLLGWLFYLNWQLTLVTFIVLPFIGLVVKKFSNRFRRISRSIQDSQGNITEVLQESIEGHKIIKIFGGQNYEKERFYNIVDNQRKLNMRGTVAAAAQSPLVHFFVATALVLIMGIAIKQAGTDQNSVGGFVSFITAMLMLLAPVRRLTDVNSPIQRGLAAAESVFAVIDQTPEIDEGKTVLENARGEIVFDDVRFTYAGSERAALSGVSFHVKAGECVALIGQSGSGKTTIANLLPRFYVVDETLGNIKIDGVLLKDISLQSLRQNIALVSQDVVLFNDSIFANIAYGSDASEEEIKAAAKAANALEFIEVMPQGFNSLIGENGVKLSGGQRQRLAIARALLKNAPILILDEATSALDNESERLVQEALEKLMQNRTTIVIAHRLSTIENADRIIVLTEGKIVEEGDHQTLLAKDGTYAKLYRLQSVENEKKQA